MRGSLRLRDWTSIKINLSKTVKELRQYVIAVSGRQASQTGGSHEGLCQSCFCELSHSSSSPFIPTCLSFSKHRFLPVINSRNVAQLLLLYHQRPPRTFSYISDQTAETRTLATVMDGPRLSSLPGSFFSFYRKFSVKDQPSMIVAEEWGTVAKKKIICKYIDILFHSIQYRLSGWKELIYGNHFTIPMSLQPPPTLLHSCILESFNHHGD